MKRILLFVILTGFGLSSKAQSLIGSSIAAITDSMKKQDSFDQGAKPDDGGSTILTYVNFMHKDGTFKVDDSFILMSSQFQIKNNKCIAEFYIYKDVLLNKCVTSFNTNKAKYTPLGNNEWVDKKDNLSVKITLISEEKCFLIQYELK
jgi:hypothetical protein